MSESTLAPNAAERDHVLSDSIRAAEALHRHDRARGWSELAALFRMGGAPSPALDGRYNGALVALDLFPGVTEIVGPLLGGHLPWLGKRFDAAGASGDNIFLRSSKSLAVLNSPTYHGYVEDTPETYRAYRFVTRTGPGFSDHDISVLTLDYNLPENPSGNVRRVLDEIVQLPDGGLLGKAHLKLYWGEWKLVAFFAVKAA